jgi:hypothetical protein
MNPIRAIAQRLRNLLTGRFLCDTCKYDYGDACSRPERPNAVVCPDYSKG